jgi:hypothetical protein
MRTRRVLLSAAALWSSASIAAPVAADAGAPQSLDGGARGTENAPGGVCVERLAGKARPPLKESVPDRGVSGHAVVLDVTLEHGKGERVLPGGFEFGLSEESTKALEQSGFFLPHAKGGAGPRIQSDAAGERVKTRVTIPFVALPQKPGRQVLQLPPVPITLARASGEVVTLCTQPHAVTIEDPIANTPHAEPKPNPPPRRQPELWTAAKNATLIALLALLVGALVAWLVMKWRRRPRPVPAPPPPRPPWEVALEELFDIRNAGYVREQRFAEYFDRVSDTVRTYLGARYGFDGLECTTRETLSMLRRIDPPIRVLSEIEGFLRQADLVKFARLTPTEAECEIALERGEHVVRMTLPELPPAAAPPPPVPPPPGSSAVQSSVAPPGGGPS